MAEAEEEEQKGGGVAALYASREKGCTVVGPLYRDPRPAAQLLISSVAHQSLVHDHRLVKSRPPYRRNLGTLLRELSLTATRGTERGYSFSYITYIHMYTSSNVRQTVSRNFSFSLSSFLRLYVPFNFFFLPSDLFSSALPRISSFQLSLFLLVRSLSSYFDPRSSLDRSTTFSLVHVEAGLSYSLKKRHGVPIFGPWIAEPVPSPFEDSIDGPLQRPASFPRRRIDRDIAVRGGTTGPVPRSRL